MPRSQFAAPHIGGHYPMDNIKSMTVGVEPQQPTLHAGAHALAQQIESGLYTALARIEQLNQGLRLSPPKPQGLMSESDVAPGTLDVLEKCLAVSGILSDEITRLENLLRG